MRKQLQLTTPIHQHLPTHLVVNDGCVITVQPNKPIVPAKPKKAATTFSNALAMGLLILLLGILLAL